MKQTYEEAVLKTVLFWSEKSFGGKMNQNNGDDSPQGGMVSMMMNMLSMDAQEEATPEKIKVFESKLTELLMSAENRQFGVTLSVDYDPCEMLYLAAKEACINTRAFPCKTFTTIEKDNKVIAKYQYGGKFVTL